MKKKIFSTREKSSQIKSTNNSQLLNFSKPSSNLNQGQNKNFCLIKKDIVKHPDKKINQESVNQNKKPKINTKSISIIKKNNISYIESRIKSSTEEKKSDSKEKIFNKIPIKISKNLNKDFSPFNSVRKEISIREKKISENSFVSTNFHKYQNFTNRGKLLSFSKTNNNSFRNKNSFDVSFLDDYRRNLVQIIENDNKSRRIRMSAINSISFQVKSNKNEKLNYSCSVDPPRSLVFKKTNENFEIKSRNKEESRDEFTTDEFIRRLIPHTNPLKNRKIEEEMNKRTKNSSQESSLKINNYTINNDCESLESLHFQFVDLIKKGKFIVNRSELKKVNENEIKSNKSVLVFQEVDFS